MDTSFGATQQEFEAVLTAARPDACQFRLEQILPPDGGQSDEDCARDLLNLCEKLEIGGVQFSLHQPTDIDWFYAFRQYGIIPPESCRALLFVMGGADGEEPASEPPHRLRGGFLAGLERQNLLGKVAWTVAAFGPQETAALTAAMALGGHVAPGPAYNIHTVEGDPPFASVQEQLTALAEMAERLGGRPTASAFEARTLLFGAR